MVGGGLPGAGGGGSPGGVVGDGDGDGGGGYSPGAVGVGMTTARAVSRGSRSSSPQPAADRQSSALITNVLRPPVLERPGQVMCLIRVLPSLLCEWVSGRLEPPRPPGRRARDPGGGSPVDTMSPSVTPMPCHQGGPMCVRRDSDRLTGKGQDRGLGPAPPAWAVERRSPRAPTGQASGPRAQRHDPWRQRCSCAGGQVFSVQPVAVLR
jgi:hypothetical protein